MGTDVVTKAVKKYATLAGLDAKRISPHSFRHSAARIRYEQGEDIRSLQRLLRHSSLGVTDHYLTILSSSADPGAKRLEQMFSGF